MRFSGLSIRQLEAFEATMLASTVSGAAASLNISQPSVSRLLQELEADTGLKLFDRSHGRLIPTEQGLLFYEEVGRTFHSARNLIKAAQEIKELKRGVLRIGTMAALSFNVVPEAIRLLRAEFAAAKATIAVRSSKEIASSVALRSTDVGIVDADVAFLDAKCVATFEQRCVCVMDKMHPLATCEKIGLSDFAKYPFVSLGESYFGRSRDGERLLEMTAPNVVADTFQSALACTLVRGTEYLAVADPFTSRFYAEFGVVSKDIDLEISFRTSILVNERSQTGIAVQSIIRIISELLAVRP